jgi:hypothetical protein
VRFKRATSIRVSVNPFYSTKMQEFSTQIFGSTNVDDHLSQFVSLYLDYLNDESYTPQSVSVKAGTTLYDMEVRTNLECVLAWNYY